jgi:hypothetical protein
MVVVEARIEPPTIRASTLSKRKPFSVHPEPDFESGGLFYGGLCNELRPCVPSRAMQSDVFLDQSRPRSGQAQRPALSGTDALRACGAYEFQQLLLGGDA